MGVGGAVGRVCDRMPSGFDFKADRLLDPIALVGGAKAPVYDTFFRLSGDGVTATM